MKRHLIWFVCLLFWLTGCGTIVYVGGKPYTLTDDVAKGYLDNWKEFKYDISKSSFPEEDRNLTLTIIALNEHQYCNKLALKRIHKYESSTDAWYNGSKFKAPSTEEWWEIKTCSDTMTYRVLRMPPYGLLIYPLGSAYAPSPKDCHPFSDSEGFGRWMQSYRNSPTPQNIIAALTFLDQSGILEQRELNREIQSAFLSFIIKDNPKHIETWANAVKGMQRGTRRTFWAALREADTLESVEALRDSISKKDVKDNEFISQLLNEPFKNFETFPITRLVDLDVLWSAYFASGKNIFIERIISVLKYPQRRKLERKRIPDAAKWSLYENAKEHNSILIICKKEYQNLNGQAQNELGKIIERIEKNQS